MPPQNIQSRGEPTLFSPELILDPSDMPQAGELGNAEPALPQRPELRRGSREAVHASELGGADALHVDAVPEERVPGEVVVRVGDEDARTFEDAQRVLAPHAVELRAARVDHGGNASGDHAAPA